MKSKQFRAEQVLAILETGRDSNTLHSLIGNLASIRIYVYRSRCYHTKSSVAHLLAVASSISETFLKIPRARTHWQCSVQHAES
jgi:hypothetical protein